MGTPYINTLDVSYFHRGLLALPAVGIRRSGSCSLLIILLFPPSQRNMRFTLLSSVVAALFVQQTISLPFVKRGITASGMLL